MGISLSDLSPNAREQVLAKVAIEEARRRNKRNPALDVHTPTIFPNRGADDCTYTIYGEPRTKKNSSQILVNNRTGKRFVSPSKQYHKYEKNAGEYLLPRPKAPIDIPVNVKCVYFMGTHRTVDLANLISATCDILVHYGILADDNSKIVVSHDGSRVDYDKEKPRAEITITEV